MTDLHAPNKQTAVRPFSQLAQYRWLRLIITTGVVALAVMASSLAVGLFAGWALRRRWALLLAAIVTIITVELTRLEVPICPSTYSTARPNFLPGVTWRWNGLTCWMPPSSACTPLTMRLTPRRLSILRHSPGS